MPRSVIIAERDIDDINNAAKQLAEVIEVPNHIRTVDALTVPMVMSLAREQLLQLRSDLTKASDLIDVLKQSAKEV